nr:hypothetical protein [Clostridium folliculivorans]
MLKRYVYRVFFYCFAYVYVDGVPNSLSKGKKEYQR